MRTATQYVIHATLVIVKGRSTTIARGGTDHKVPCRRVDTRGTTTATTTTTSITTTWGVIVDRG